MEQIEAFLRKHIEGYLFHDLDSMAEIPVERSPGNCSYSMALVELAGIELMGALVSRGTSDEQRFSDGWTQIVYAGNGDAAGCGKTVRALARHGLAHLFVAKPSIVVRKVGSGHLQRDQTGSLVLDVLVLADDIKAGYRANLLPMLADADGRRRISENLMRLMKGGLDASNGHQPVIAARPLLQLDPSELARVDCSSTTYTRAFVHELKVAGNTPKR